MEEIGRIERLARFPIKSMAEVQLNEAMLDWHGLLGDRRYAVRNVTSQNFFPWITASQVPELLLFHAVDFETREGEPVPTSVRTPSGSKLGIHTDQLREELSQLAGSRVELMGIKHGVFDDSVISVIATSTISHVCREAGVPVDSRRFRANIELRLDAPIPFAEDTWVDLVLRFGPTSDAPAILVVKRDVRCKMISLDPDSAEHNPQVLKSVVRLNENCSGVYGSVISTGKIRIGDPVFVLHRNDVAQGIG